MSFVYSVDVKGNIRSNNKLSVNLCIPKFNSGAWMIKISSVAYHAKDPNLNGICQIFSNLVKGQRHSANNRIEIYNPSLATVLMKASNNDYNVIYLEQNWFTVNEISDFLELSFIDFESTLPFLHNTFISVGLLLKKVQ